MSEASMDQTKEELVAMALELGLEVNSRDTKEILVSKINGDDQPEQPAAPKSPAAKPSNVLKKFHKFRGAKA
jgi:hypothetical protein